jgi:predicted MFS family arabinose efflux permease
LGFFYGAGQIVLSTLMLRSVQAERANLYFSVFNIISMTCMAFGNLIGGYLPTWLAGADFATDARGYGSALLFCACLLMVAVIPLFGIVNAARKRKTNESILHDVPYKSIVFLCVPMLAFGFTGGLTFPFYNLLFRTTFALPDPSIGQLLGFGSLSMALVPMLNPMLARRFGSSTALTLLMLVASVAFFVLGTAAGMGILSTSIVAYLVAVGTRNTMQPLFQPLLMGRLAPELHNVGNSIALVIWNIGWFTATAISGQLQTSIGYPAIMLVVSVGVLVTAGSMYGIYRVPRKAKSELKVEG